MYISMYVLFCHVIYGCFVCILYVCIYIYIYIYIYIHIYIYIYIYIYVYVCASVCIYACVYVCVGTLSYLCKSYLFKCLSSRYLGCYLVVWHCYLGSILAFSFKFQNLNTAICTKTSNKSTYVL